MKKLKLVFQGFLLFGILVLTTSHKSVNKELTKVTLEECIAPGYVSLLGTVPQNCQSTIYANSAFATGANWTVTGGILVSGQGTLAIVIQPTTFMGSNITVTCRTFNECAYSTNTASKTYWVDCS